MCAVDPPEIITLEELADVLEGWELEFARHRSTGGESFAKGYHYELQYAIRRIVEMAGRAYGIFERGEHLDPARLFYIKGQVAGFVDDLVTLEPSEKVGYADRVVYSQLKNASGVTWEAGDRPLSLAFRLEKQLLWLLERRAQLELVVSSKKAQNRLLEQPAGLKDVIVKYRIDLHLPDGLAAVPRLRAILKKMHFPFVDQNTSRNLVSALIGAWFELDCKAYLGDLLDVVFDSDDVFILRPKVQSFPFDDEIFDFLEKRFCIAMRGARIVFASAWPRIRGEMMFDCGTEKWDVMQAWILENLDAGTFEFLAAMEEIENAF